MKTLFFVRFHSCKKQLRKKILKNSIKNRSLHFAAYKQFVWWIYQRLGKGSKRVLQPCVLWKIRQHYPASNGQYILYNAGKRLIKIISILIFQSLL